MFEWFDRLLNWLRQLFWKQELEVTLVGLQGAGKTTFVNDKRNLKFVLESYYLRLIDLITVAVFLFTNFSNLQISKHQKHLAVVQ